MFYYIRGVFPPIQEPYSQELRSLVEQMVDIDPKKRPEISDVCRIAGQMLKKCSNNKKRPRIKQRTSITDQVSTTAVAQNGFHDNDDRENVSDVNIQTTKPVIIKSVVVTSSLPSAPSLLSSGIPNHTEKNVVNKSNSNNHVNERYSLIQKEVLPPITTSKYHSMLEVADGAVAHNNSSKQQIGHGSLNGNNDTFQDSTNVLIQDWRACSLLDEIFEKLKLLNYEELYCKAKSKR